MIYAPLGTEVARSSRPSQTKVIALEDAETDKSDLLNQALDRVMPVRSLRLRSGRSILMAPFDDRAFRALLKIRSTSFRGGTPHSSRACTTWDPCDEFREISRKPSPCSRGLSACTGPRCRPWRIPRVRRRPRTISPRNPAPWELPRAALRLAPGDPGTAAPTAFTSDTSTNFVQWTAVMSGVGSDIGGATAMASGARSDIGGATAVVSGCRVQHRRRNRHGKRCRVQRRRRNRCGQRWRESKSKAGPLW